MLKAFGVEVERTEIDIAAQEYVLDANGNAVPCLSNEQISEYAQLIKDRFKIEADKIAAKSNEILIKFNDKNKTNYPTVKQIPVGDTFDELKKFAIALSNMKNNI